MTAPKATFKFQDYKGILPYSSELFGVYQPLLGWKSKRAERRFAIAYATEPLDLVEKLSAGFAPKLAIDSRASALQLTGFDPGKPLDEVPASRSLLVTALRQALHAKHGEQADKLSDAELAHTIDLPALTSLLQHDVSTALTARMHAASAPREVRAALSGAAAPARAFTADHAKAALEYEGRLAATLLHLKSGGQLTAVRTLLFPTDWKQRSAGLARALNAKSVLQQFVPPQADAQFDLDRVALSPIGIVHLFRQFFFELDTFLGSPVGHVWVSPGTTLELYEVSTRRVLVERTISQSVETTKKSELASTDQDELAAAVKQDNQQDIKFGASVSASYAGVTASSNFGMNSTQKQAREDSHKHMRQQSSKLSTEIKTNYKTSFKLVTETTDTSSKRYVIQNSSTALQNYELRRKMRQVAVQVQDVGTYLCWQTFVDNPGDTLELSTLIHIAQPADLDSIPHPDAPALLENMSKDYPISFAYENVSGGDDTDVIFYKGDDRESWPDHNDIVVWEREFHIDPPQLGYTLDKSSLSVTSLHSDICVATIALIDDTGRVKVSLDQVNFVKQPAVKLQISATWTPPSQAKALADYANKMLDYSNAKLRAQKEAYNKAVQERIKLTSQIAPRPADDLREEERITIYRKLLQEMLLPKGYGSNDPVPETKDTLAARHVLSELISSIFDIDKMLYFVAPEWWKPRVAKAKQNFGISTLLMDPVTGMVSEREASVGKISVADQVGWERAGDTDRDHYLITDASSPAKLGSSLGWLLQLDADDLRNAFLNAPWVKAVVPIRPGKETAAIAWLKHVEGMNGIGPGDLYDGDGTDADGHPLKGKTLLDVIGILADAVSKKHAESLVPREFDLTDPELPHDPDSTVTATPVDRVWEHGFDPLKGGFQARPLASDKPGSDGSEYFQIFDQWVEILPTDQVVPVAVEYDPKTGRLK